MVMVISYHILLLPIPRYYVADLVTIPLTL